LTHMDGRRARYFSPFTKRRVRTRAMPFWGLESSEIMELVFGMRMGRAYGTCAAAD
jgi:hypothetical protein